MRRLTDILKLLTMALACCYFFKYVFGETGLIIFSAVDSIMARIIGGLL
jgi:hypothetical protein